MPGPDLLLQPRGTTDGSSACVPSLAAPMALEVAQERALLLKAVADPVRLQLLSIVTSSPGHEACVCDMTDAVQVSQPTVSHHLKILVEAGVLTRERRGTWAWYSLVPGRLTDITSMFG